MPSHRATARNGRNARNVRKARKAATLASPNRSAMVIVIDTCSRKTQRDRSLD